MAVREVIMGSKRYTEEFKVEAVRQVVEHGHSVAEVASRLGMTTHSLYAWKMKYGPDSTAHQEKTATEIENRRRIVRGLGFERVLFPKTVIKKAANW